MPALTVEQAAEYLHLHPVTVCDKARAGDLPAAKVGKRWLFLQVDLDEWLRSQYQPRALQGVTTGRAMQCHSSNAKTACFIGSNSPSTEDEYRKALGLTTGKPPRNTTTGARRSCGSKAASA
ncbi:MAG: DNA-binding protein [Methylococcaceae bacterium]|nr:MAG: DNA-binding protein [Methylococcaceae bacterium]